MRRGAYTSLADYLERSGDTQERLAARLKMSQPTISRAKDGKGSLKLLSRIAREIGVPLESFVGKAA